MNFSKVKTGKISYWGNEPVKVNSKSIEKDYGKCVHITRYAAKDKKQNGYATVSPDVLSENPAQLNACRIPAFSGICRQATVFTSTKIQHNEKYNSMETRR